MTAHVMAFYNGTMYAPTTPPHICILPDEGMM